MPAEICLHKNLVLLAERQGRVRCRHCHLTIQQVELNGYCPEYYKTSGQKRNDFDEVAVEAGGMCNISVKIAAYSSRLREYTVE